MDTDSRTADVLLKEPKFCNVSVQAKFDLEFQLHGIAGSLFLYKCKYKGIMTEKLDQEQRQA